MNPIAKTLLAAAVATAASVLCADAAMPVGSWTGSLNVPPRQSLKLTLHISQEGKVTMDSPDQGAYDIECQTIHLSPDSININIPSLRVKYAAHISPDRIQGTFRQGLLKLPLDLVAGDGKANRPQTPVAPFPYSTEEVSIVNGDESVALAGTLTIPENTSKKTPVVLLVTGSGLQNRDEELFEHKPFAVIADYLARNGIASLRYDDRGFGQSKGDASTATTADFAEDAASAIDWLRRTRRFGSVGILGHSEGGQIAYMLGARKNAPDFIVSIAGPAIKGTSTIAYQNKIALLNSGIAPEQAEEFQSAILRSLEYRLAHPDVSAIDDTLLAELYPGYKANPVLATALRQSFSSRSSNPWMDFFLAYDPQSDMKSIRRPMLIIYGEKDRQVPPSLNLEPARKYSPRAKVVEYPDLNHLMQHAVSGNVEEYKQIEETISPEVLADIATFIKSTK